MTHESAPQPSCKDWSTALCLYSSLREIVHTYTAVDHVPRTMYILHTEDAKTLRRPLSALKGDERCTTYRRRGDFKKSVECPQRGGAIVFLSGARFSRQQRHIKGCQSMSKIIFSERFGPEISETTSTLLEPQSRSGDKPVKF